jgi:hypothetical protein
LRLDFGGKPAYNGIGPMQRKKRALRVYIAGPMTNGGTGYAMPKVKEGIEAYLCLIEHGFVPHCPQLTMFCDFLQPGRIPYAKWLELDHNYISDCDVVLRIPGPSKGADSECEFAKELYIPVIEGLGNFLCKYKTPYPEN